MKRVVVVVIVVVAAGIGMWLWRGRGESSSTTEPARGSSATSVVTPTNPPVLQNVSADHEQQEIESTTAIAHELSLSDAETNDVLAALKQLQQGRRALFDDLAAKRITTEQVSTRLHELRSQMRDQIVAAIGRDRADRVLDRIRDEHR